jgi:uracil-DNA glycosylase family 4
MNNSRSSLYRSVASHLTSKVARHKTHWADCHTCQLCRNRTHTVLFRGDIPAQILIAGEAPGESENLVGYPFAGPAGKLLDEILEGAFEASGRYPSICLSNIVACIPCESSETESLTIRQPTKAEAQACSPRLRELINLCSPRLVVTLGQVAAKYLPLSLPQRIQTLAIVHPAHILRESNPSKQELGKKRCVLTLASAFRKVGQ